MASSSNRNLSISSSSEEEDVALPRLQPVQGALTKVAGWPKECPVGLDDELVEDCEGLENGAEIRLYELNNNCLP